MLHLLIFTKMIVHNPKNEGEVVVDSGIDDVVGGGDRGMALFSSKMEEEVVVVVAVDSTRKFFPFHTKNEVVVAAEGSSQKVFSCGARMKEEEEVEA